jgi:hypothetical protein
MERWLAAPTPDDALGFLALEGAVMKDAQRHADAILEHHLVQAHHNQPFVERAVRAVRQRHDGRLRHKGQRPTWVLLPGGTRCRVETPYLRPAPPRRPGRKRSKRGPTGPGVYPVLEALGISDGVSPATRSALALYTVQAGSYQEAVSLLGEHGLQLDRKTLRRVALSTARADIRVRDAALEKACQMPVEPGGSLAGLRVRVSLDGGRVRTRELHPGRKTKNGRHRFETPWREPRVLVVDVLDGAGKSDRLRLPLYDVLLDDADSTEALVIGYLRLLGAAHAEVVEFIADGATWIWERSERIRRQAQIPVNRWVEVIDFYHASGHLHETIELCRDRTVGERTQWYERLRHTLRTDADGVDKVVEALKPEARGRRAKTMKRAVGYFERHRERMRYVTMDRRRLPVGSGPVESAVRRVVNLRFKAPSIFWEADTVGDLMHLRAAFKAGRWDELVERVLTHSFPVPSFDRMTQAQIDAALPLDPEDGSDQQTLRGAA